MSSSGKIMTISCQIDLGAIEPISNTVNLRVYGALYFRRQKSKVGGAPYTQVQDILSPQNATF